MGVIAEGVETKEQAELLRELECQCIQGYLVSKPVDAAETDRMILSSLQQWEEGVLHRQDIYEKEFQDALASAYPM